MGKGETIRLPFGAIRPIFKGTMALMLVSGRVFFGRVGESRCFLLKLRELLYHFNPLQKPSQGWQLGRLRGARHIRRDRPFTQAESPSNQGSFPAPVLKHVIHKKNVYPAVYTTAIYIRSWWKEIMHAVHNLDNFETQLPFLQKFFRIKG